MAQHPFVRPEIKARLKGAVESVEKVSSAEVVVAVRPWSGTYWYVDCYVGAALALAGLLFMLYSESFVFPLWLIAVGSAGLFAAGVAVSALFTPLRFAIMPRRLVDRQVELAAKALFYDLGVSRTRDRSGILLYVSLLEHRCVVVPDVGILQGVPEDEWTKVRAPVAEAVPRHGVGPAGADALAAAISGMAPVLGLYLPVRPDDVNELPDLAEE